eukprot:6156999-Amphidinium_carterae.1
MCIRDSSFAFDNYNHNEVCSLPLSWPFKDIRLPENKTEPRLWLWQGSLAAIQESMHCYTVATIQIHCLLAQLVHGVVQVLSGLVGISELLA